MKESRFSNGRHCATHENVTVRDHARKKGVPLWLIAERYGVSDTKFSVMLRRDLPAETQDELVSIIDEIARERKNTYAGG